MTAHNTVAILGYGAQGKAWAHCLRASGWNVVVGGRPGNSLNTAKSDGFSTGSLSWATRQANLVAILLPDEDHETLWNTDIAHALQPNTTVCFAHGYSLTYSHLPFPPHTNRILVAPKGPGPDLWQAYNHAKDMRWMLSIEKDTTHTANTVATRLAQGLGLQLQYMIPTTAAEEATTDLFGEQMVLCGGLIGLVETGVETLVQKGYSPQVAYTECVHELTLLIRLLSHKGIGGTWKTISNTAEYGGRKTCKIIKKLLSPLAQKTLQDIESGAFANAWKKEHTSGDQWLKAQRKADTTNPVDATWSDWNVAPKDA